MLEKRLFFSSLIDVNKLRSRKIIVLSSRADTIPILSCCASSTLYFKGPYLGQPLSCQHCSVKTDQRDLPPL